MSTPADKYNKAGWKKYEFPPDMITAEQNEKKMKLTWPQIKRLMGKQIESRIYSSTQSGDVVTAKEWKAFSVRMQAKDMTQRINEEFIQDFMKWLTGRSTWNSTKYFEIVQDEYGVAVSKEVTGGCPWGNTPLTTLPGVAEFLDQGIDRRSKVIEYIAKLKLRGPRNLDEAYMYYKYILRKVAVDDDACYEVQEMADFDYPTDPKTGETVGPAQVDTPPLFDEVRYTANFLMVYSLTVADPAMTAEWIANGAKALDLERLGTGLDMIDPRDVASFLYSDDYDRLRMPGGNYQYVKDYIYGPGDGEENYIRREEEARRVTRERDRRRRLRKAGRAPSAKMAAGSTAKKGIDATQFLLGPEGRKQSRRLARREARRDDRIDDEREDLAVALSEEYFGTKNYVSFWALSPNDQDYIMALLLAQNAFASAAQALASPAATGAAGGPVTFPEARRNEEKYAYPAEETEQVDKGAKKKVDRLTDLSKQIRALPGSVSDPATQKILKDIHTTIKKIADKKDTVPDVIVKNNQPININNDGLIGAVKLNTQMIENLKAVIGRLDLKIGNLNLGGGGRSPPLEIPQDFRTRVEQMDQKLGQVVEVLGGLPPEIAKHIPRPPPGAGGVGSDVPLNPDQIMTDRADFHVGTAVVHNPTGPWTVQKQTVTNNYTGGDINFGHITGEQIGEGLGRTLGAPQVSVSTGDIHVQPNVNIERVEPNVNIAEVNPNVYITLDGSKMTVPTPDLTLNFDASKIPVPNLYPQVSIEGGVNLPQGLGAEIGKHMPPAQFNVDVDALGRRIGEAIKVPAGQTDVKVDLSELTQKLETYLGEHNESKTELMNIQAEHSRQIGDLYKEIKDLRLKESSRLDAMKKVLDEMTPLQTAVAGILAKNPAAKDIEGDVHIEEKSLPEKIEQVMKLDQDTIDKLINGNAKGLGELKTEMQKLLGALNQGLFTDINHAQTGAPVKVGMAQIAEQIYRKSAITSEVLKGTLEYVPKELRGSVSPNLVTTLIDKVNDPDSIFNRTQFKVAEITDKNFTDMTKNITSIEKQLVQEQATLKTQKENLDLLRNQIKINFDKAQAEATEKTNAEREAVKAEVINLRNQYATKEAELAQKVNDLATLGHSHQSLLKAFEEYKTKTGDKATQLRTVLKDVIGKDLKPIIEQSTQQVVDAIDLSLGAGVDEDNEEEDDGGEDRGAEEKGPELSKKEKKEALIVTEGQHLAYNWLQAEGELPSNIELKPPEVFVDKQAVETKRTLEQLINEAIAADPAASAYTILKNPIEAVLHNLQSFKEEKGHIKPEDLSVEDRLKRNELFTAEAYMRNLENRFSSLPEEIRTTFVNPIQGADPENRLKSVVMGLTLLSREKNSIKESKSSFKRFSELLTNYRETINQMAEDPDWNGRSKLAEDYINKLSGARARDMTGYYFNDRVMIQPTNASEMDSYATLVKVGREMVKAHTRGDEVTFQELTRQAQDYSAFTDVPFVKSSPLYNSIASGDISAISHQLSSEGTSHINRDYFTTSFKARVDMQYQGFKAKMDLSRRSTEDPHQKASLKHAINNIQKSGMSEAALVSHPDFSDQITNVSMEETSVYMQAYMRAAMMHNLMRMNLHNVVGENKDIGTMQTLAKTPEVLRSELQVMKDQFDIVADNSTTLQMDHPDNQLVQKLYQDRQESIKTLSEKMFTAMTYSMLPEFQSLTKDKKAIQAYGQDATTVASEAVDTLLGFSDGNIVGALLQKGKLMTDNGDVTSLPSGKLVASQLKNAVEGLEKEAKKPLNDMVAQAVSNVAKLINDLKAKTFEDMYQNFPNVFHAMPRAVVA